MEKQRSYPPMFLRKRRFLLMLPLLVIPFLTLGFWALGGGREKQTTFSKSTVGLNLVLPPARDLEKSASNKLQLYEQADKDSLKFHHFFQVDAVDKPSIPLTDTVFSENRQSSPPLFLYDPSPASINASGNTTEAKIYQKLAELQAPLQAAPGQWEQSSGMSHNTLQAPGPTMNVDENLGHQNRLQHPRTESREEDPELQQLNGMMDKIIQIQHPERMQRKIPSQYGAAHKQAFTISVPKQADSITLLTSKQSPSATFYPSENEQEAELHNGFYALPEDSLLTQAATSIEAVVDYTQTLVSGATIRLRLCRDVYIDRVLVPKDQVLYGLTSLNGERLQVHIPSILYQNTILPVDLSVYDMDGLEGIFVPGTITRDAARQASETMVQGINLNSPNHSLAAEAANASVEAAKTLFNRKARLVKVTIKAGYQVLLQDNKPQDFISY